MPPHCPGKPSAKAEVVKGAPVSPPFHRPDEIITIPVKVHTTSVSINVCVIETKAWSTGFFVFAAAAAMGELPSPLSLENTPRATPHRAVCITMAPANPPLAAVGVNACLNTSAKASGTALIFITITANAPNI